MFSLCSVYKFRAHTDFAFLYTSTHRRATLAPLFSVKTFHDKTRESSFFLVGAGAIGCEMLKNWALMGLGTRGGAKIHITDMDIIEKSNLNRQFLFRPSDVKKAKSTCAAEKAKEMNPEFNVVAYEDKVAPDTENIFTDAFWDSLDCVCTALDNVQARLYVDQVSYTKTYTKVDVYEGIKLY